MQVFKIAGRFFVGLLTIVSLLLPAVVCASTLQVMPVGVVLSASRPASSVSMINSGDEPVVVQGQLVEWKLVDGEHVFAPTDEVVFNPPAFTVDPGKSQTIRVGMIKLLNNPVEKSYRLFLEEVPASEADKGKVRMALRFSLPVYVSPVVPAQEDMAIDAKSAFGSVTVRLANKGNVRTTVKRILLFSAANDRQLAEHTGHLNLIAGGTSKVTLTLPSTLPTGQMRVLVETAKGKKHEAGVSR